MFLSVNEYNIKEKEGKQALSNRFIEAFQPELFEKIGFPTRIEDEKEVYKFLDSMHDGRLARYYGSYNFVYAPTYEEYEMMKIMAKDIYQLTEKRYAKGILVKAPLLASMNIFRKIKYIEEETLPTVFEIGGGNGVLGALLHRSGHKYISTDITQAFYLTQNNLWEGLESDCVMECMDSLENLNDTEKYKMIHIPYWKLWELRNSDLEADIMVSNHNLAEMHERALRFYLQYAKQLMRNSEYKLFIAQAPGSVRFRNVDYLLRTFSEMGFELLYSERYFIIFALRDKKEIIPVHIGDLMRKENFEDAFPVCGNPLDKTVETIYIGEQKVRNKTKVSLQEIKEFYLSLDKNIDSPDEEFIHYCGFTDI